MPSMIPAEEKKKAANIFKVSCCFFFFIHLEGKKGITSNGKNVLQRSSNFNSNHVICGVHSNELRREQFLYFDWKSSPKKKNKYNNNKYERRVNSMMC
jgi:uncharacterized CHY-type Zn-finger protein